MFSYLRHYLSADHHHYPLLLWIPMFPRAAMGYPKHTFPSTPSLLHTNYETTYISFPPSTPFFLWTLSCSCPVSNAKFKEWPQACAGVIALLAKISWTMCCALTSHTGKSISWVKSKVFTSLIDLSSTHWVLGHHILTNIDGARWHPTFTHAWANWGTHSCHNWIPDELQLFERSLLSPWMLYSTR